jgi:hypothetical protein
MPAKKQLIDSGETAVIEDEPVRFRFLKRRQMFTKTAVINGEQKVFTFRAKAHILSLDPANKVQADLIQYLRKHRGNGTEFREVVPGGDQTNLTDDATTLDRLLVMDKSEIWAFFEPFELDGLMLDQTTSKSELIAAFLKLKKRIPLS